ncbi:MAG: ATP-binding protein [Nitrospira sp.]
MVPARAGGWVSYGGTGLGLALAKQLVELMGGTMEFERMPGKGSRFWFDLPLAGASASMPEAVRPREALVYVKEVISQAVIRRTLEKLGYHVHTLADVEDLERIGPEVAPMLFVVECNVLVQELVDACPKVEGALLSVANSRAGARVVQQRDSTGSSLPRRWTHRKTFDGRVDQIFCRAFGSESP